MIMKKTRALASALLSLATLSGAAHAADHADVHQADWIAPSFTFHSGEILRNFKLHYTTLGTPGHPAVLILHGTNGSGAKMLGKDFAGQLFGPGQPLDSSKYFIIIPDAIGTGKSAKPSDGLRAAFPPYNYADMVLAQYRLVTEGLGVKHLRLVLGNSMGGMQTWLWGETYPDMMDGLVPMASQPAEMASRNWMMRRALVESIKQDPAWDNGNYSSQPPSLRLAGIMFAIATNGGSLAYQAQAGTHVQAEQRINAELAAPVTDDANDFIYQWGSSADFNAMPKLGQIQAPVLAINAADDERNPPETGVMLTALKQVRQASLYLIPASSDTRGHGTTGFARFYARQLDDFLSTLPAR